MLCESNPTTVLLKTNPTHNNHSRHNIYKIEKIEIHIGDNNRNASGSQSASKTKYVAFGALGLAAGVGAMMLLGGTPFLVVGFKLAVGAPAALIKGTAVKTVATKAVLAAA